MKENTVGSQSVESRPNWRAIRSLRKKRFSSDHSDTAGALGCEFSADGASRRPCAGLPP